MSNAETPGSEPPVIYTVTVMREADIKDPRSFPKTSRVWGFEMSLEEADRVVLSNQSDLFEFYYQYAVIEEVPAGVPAWGDGPLRTWWYKGTYRDGRCYPEKCECPEVYQGQMNFSMG